MKLAKFSFAPIPALIGLSFAALFSWGLSHWTGLSFWAAFPITIAAMLINGLIADAEDNAPGGFNNPLPRDNPRTPPEDANDKTRNA